MFITPLMFGAVYGWAIGILEVVILAISGGWLWHRDEAEGFSWRQHWGLIPLLVFIALALAQLLPWPALIMQYLAPENLAAWIRLRELDLGTGRYFPVSLNPFATGYEGLKFFCYALAAWLTIDLIKQSREGRAQNFAYAVALVVCFTGALITAVAIVQTGLEAKQIYGFWKPYHSDQFIGPYVNRNNFAGYLEMALPMGIALFGALTMQTQGSWDDTWDSRSDKRLALTFLVGLSVLLMLTGLLFSLSRGGVLAGGVVVAAQVPFLLALVSRRSSRRKILWCGLIAAIFISVVGSLVPWEKLGGRFRTLPTESITMDIRYQVFKDTWDMAKDYPVLGSGLGSYERVFPRYKTWPTQSLFQHAHNDYLEFLSEMGWAGFLPLMVFFSWVVIRGLKYLAFTLRLGARCPRAVVSRACLVSGSLGGVIAILLHGTVDFNLHIPANALLFFVLCGITVSFRPEKI